MAVVSDDEHAVTPNAVGMVIKNGPRTLIVNATGSAVQLMSIVETSIAARLGRFLPGDEHVLAGEASAMLHGTMAAWRDGLRVA